MPFLQRALWAFSIPPGPWGFPLADGVSAVRARAKTPHSTAVPSDWLHFTMTHRRSHPILHFLLNVAVVLAFGAIIVALWGACIVLTIANGGWRCDAYVRSC